MRLLNKTILEDSGRFKVVGEAQDGQQAIDLARKLKPDVILLDLAMPVLGGLEALPTIRTAAPSACIIVVSMLQRVETEARALALGAKAFVDKGLDTDEFLARVLSVVKDSGPGPAA